MKVKIKKYTCSEQAKKNKQEYKQEKETNTIDV